MAACELAPQDKKAFVDAVGKELVRKHGKQKYYRPADVADAANASGFFGGCALLGLLHFHQPKRFRIAARRRRRSVQLFGDAE